MPLLDGLRVELLDPTQQTLHAALSLSFNIDREFWTWPFMVLIVLKYMLVVLSSRKLVLLLLKHIQINIIDSSTPLKNDECDPQKGRKTFLNIFILTAAKNCTSNPVLFNWLRKDIKKAILGSKIVILTPKTGQTS